MLINNMLIYCMNFCKKCGEKISSFIYVNGIKRSLHNRKYCFNCSKRQIPQKHQLEVEKIKILSYRQKTKLKSLDYKGNKCELCGYNACKESLAFHHLNPKEKEFNLSRVSKKWETIKKELDKCILLCHNCHSEVHYLENEKNKNKIVSLSSKQAQHIKNWRHNTKNKILQIYSSKCGICNYNKCKDSLALHHLNPKEKEFTFSKIRANPKPWSLIFKELKKCILLCHNCHNEVHYQKKHIPLEAIEKRNFTDEQNLNLIKKPKLEVVKNACLICNKQKSIKKKFCSIDCSNKSKGKVKWDLIDLVNELQTKSRTQIAKELGISETAVRKRLKKLKIYLPITQR